MNNDNQHTKGKWKVMYSTSSNGDCTLAVWPDDIIEGHIGSPICKVSPSENVNDTDKANAALIAAAPDLLEALTILLEINEKVFGSATIGKPARYKAKQAILKATQCSH